MKNGKGLMTQCRCYIQNMEIQGADRNRETNDTVSLGGREPLKTRNKSVQVLGGKFTITPLSWSGSWKHWMGRPTLKPPPHTHTMFRI